MTMRTKLRLLCSMPARFAVLVWLACVCTPQPADAQRIPDVRQPYNGLWYDPREPGTGVTISTQGDLLVALIYTYRTDGNPLWLLASGTLRNGQFDAPLTEFRGGQCLGCAYTPPQIVNQARRLRLDFASHTVATMRIDDEPADRISAFAFGEVLLPFSTFGRGLSAESEPWIFPVRACWIFVRADDDRTIVGQYRFAGAAGPPTPNPPGSVSYVISGRRSLTSSDLLFCSDGSADRTIPPHCSLRENVPDSARADEIAAMPVRWTALLGDIGPNRIIAFEGPARAVAPGADPRGPNLILGFRTAEAGLFRADPREPFRCI
jgi:hypothetical protein